MRRICTRLSLLEHLAGQEMPSVEPGKYLVAKMGTVGARLFFSSIVR